jgi:hypothetical protein
MATERAARAEEELPLTASGLPQRRPGRQMVPPPLRDLPNAPAVSTEREPEQIRRRLATYQRGLEAGRHRAGEGVDLPASGAATNRELPTRGASDGATVRGAGEAVTGTVDEDRETAGGWGSARGADQDPWRPEPWLEREDDPWSRRD